MRLFDPTGIKSQDYKATYPELEKTAEFEPLTGAELMFVWYYANATSPFIEMKEEGRVIEALSSSGFKPIDKEKFLDIQFGERLEDAIIKMRSFIPGARYFGWKSIKNTYQNYLEILDKKAEEFVKTTGSGENVVTEIDYGTYANISTKLSAALPGLVAQLEEGFGVTLTASEEEEEGRAELRDWAQNREQ